jgi:hypothetical protein
VSLLEELEIMHADRIDAELTELSMKPTIIDSPIVEPKDIKTNSTGRLVSSFLASFIPLQSPVPNS